MSSIPDSTTSPEQRARYLRDLLPAISDRDLRIAATDPLIIMSLRWKPDGAPSFCASRPDWASQRRRAIYVGARVELTGPRGYSISLEKEITAEVE